MSDFFQKIPINANIKKRKKFLNDPVLVYNENAEVIVLLDEPIFDKDLVSFKNLLNEFLRVPYSVISVLPYPLNAGEDVKAVVKVYSEESINLGNYIKPNSKILCFGRSIYSISKSLDIGTDSFTDIVFNKTHFFDPNLKSHIFPTFSQSKMKETNTWEKSHILLQCKKIRAFKPILPRIATLSYSEIIDLDSFYERYKNEKLMAIDTETNGLDFTVNKVICVTMAFSNNEGFFIDWKTIENHGVNFFSEFIKDKFQIYANGKFDVNMFRAMGVPRKYLHIDFDTLNAGHNLNEIRRNSLKSHAWIYTNYGGYDKDLDDYKTKFNIKDYSKIPKKILIPYATKDAMITYQVYHKMKAHIDQIDRDFPMTNGWGLSRYYYEIVIPAVNMFCDVEYTGAYVNTDKLEEESKIMRQKLEEVEKEFLDYVGMKKADFNIESHDAVGNLFKERGFPLIELSKKGIYLSNDEVLEKYRKMGYKEAEILSRYRSLSTIHKTFIGDKSENTGFWQYLKYRADGSVRVHPHYSVMLADSGRNKCKDPNLQNQVAHGEYAEFVRGHFAVPNDDYVFMSADASGLQMRLATIVSKDPELTDVFINQSGDVHSKTTVSILLGDRILLADFLKVKKEKEKYYQIVENHNGERKLILKGDLEHKDWRVLTEFIPADMRYKSKSVNFGALFGKGATALMTMDVMPNWTEKQCKDFIKDNSLTTLTYKEKKDVFFTVAKKLRDNFFETYVGLTKWHEDSHAFAKKHGYIRSIYGAIRRLPELTVQNDTSELGKKREANLLNISLNSPIQNMESVVMHRVMVALHDFIQENNLKSFIFGNIHDAIEMYVHRSEIKIIRDKVIELAEYAHEEYEGIPIVFEGNIADPLKGQVWDCGKDWEAA